MADNPINVKQELMTHEEFSRLLDERVEMVIAKLNRKKVDASGLNKKSALHQAYLTLHEAIRNGESTETIDDLFITYEAHLKVFSIDYRRIPYKELNKRLRFKEITSLGSETGSHYQFQLALLAHRYRCLILESPPYEVNNISLIDNAVFPLIFNDLDTHLTLAYQYFHTNGEVLYRIFDEPEMQTNPFKIIEFFGEEFAAFFAEAHRITKDLGSPTLEKIESMAYRLAADYDKTTNSDSKRINLEICQDQFKTNPTLKSLMEKLRSETESRINGEGLILNLCDELLDNPPAYTTTAPEANTGESERDATLAANNAALQARILELEARCAELKATNTRQENTIAEQNDHIQGLEGNVLQLLKRTKANGRSEDINQESGRSERQMQATIPNAVTTKFPTPPTKLPVAEPQVGRTTRPQFPA